MDESNSEAPPDSGAEQDADAPDERGQADAGPEETIEDVRAQLAAEQERTAQLIDERAKRKRRSKARPDAKPAADDAPNPRMLALEQKLDGLTEQLQKRGRADAMESILTKVPEPNRITARAVLRGAQADGLIDFDGASAHVDALTHLGEQHPQLLQDNTRGTPRRAPQMVNGKPDLSGYKSMDDVPMGMREHLTDEQFTNLMGRGPGGRGNNLNL